MHLHRRTLVICASIGLLAAACSSESSSSSPPSTNATTTSTATPTTSIAETAETVGSTDTPTTDPATPTTVGMDTTTTFDPATLASEYETAGPYPVGVTTVKMANDISVEIWYPAVEGSNGTETYDVRDFTAPAIKAILTADVPATYTYPATRDAAVANNTFPVVLNSHGYSGIRVGSSFLTSHLASWGIVVVSPDHPTRDLFHAVAQIQPDVVTAPVDDLLGSLDLITAKASTAGDPFEGHVDTSRVGALGHSAGGGTVVQAAADPRIAGYVSMASGIPRDSDGNTSTAVLPDKPSFFLAGALDGVADPVRTHDAFLAVPTPSLFWEIAGVGHNGFDDFCTFGNGTGIIGIAEASGLGPLLDAQPQFRSLGEDGCVPPAAPVATTFPIIDHAVTAYFLHLFGVDATAKGLGPGASDSYAEQVTIEQR